MKLNFKEKKAQLAAFFKMEKGTLTTRLLPLSLFGILIALDQITKALIVKFIPFDHANPFITNIPLVQFDKLPKYMDHISSLPSSVWINIRHVRNQGAAWSGGDDLSGFWRIAILIAIPLILLIAFGIWSLFTKELTKVQRWAVASIMAGGLGNLIDRIFRYAKDGQDTYNGVVDFIDMSFFKIPHITPSGRWPTFNVADASILMGISLLVITMFIAEIKLKKEKSSE